MWNKFEVNIKDTRVTSLTSFWCLYFNNFEHISHFFLVFLSLTFKTGKFSLNFCKIYRLENHSKSSIYLAEFQLYLDDNECELMKFANNTEVGKCHANAICSNTIGSYICKCKNGFTGDGFYCNGKIFGRIKFRVFAFLPTHSSQVLVKSFTTTE